MLAWIWFCATVCCLVVIAIISRRYVENDDELLGEVVNLEREIARLETALHKWQKRFWGEADRHSDTISRVQKMKGSLETIIRSVEDVQGQIAGIEKFITRTDGEQHAADPT